MQGFSVNKSVETFFISFVSKKKGIDKQAQADQAKAEAMAAEEAAQAEAESNLESEHELVAYLNGEVIPLADVGDGVFSAGIPLLKFSKAAIKKAGHPDTAIFVLTNSPRLKPADSGINSTSLKNEVLRCLLQWSLPQPFIQVYTKI